MTTTLPHSITCVDLHHLGEPESIAAYLIDTGDGIAVVDPGPSSCREALDAGLSAFGGSRRDIRHILLTHIHLDHAGATGSLTRDARDARVYVHRRGARHLVDPARLLASAERIYGQDMQRLWGEFLPVDAARLEVIDERARYVIGSTRWLAAWTPGHAIHHLAWLEEREGLAFTGDVTGETSQHGTPALPVTPPPDIDLIAWRPSLDLIRSWGPEALLLTHFGPVRNATRHIDELWSRLLEWSDHVERTLDEPGSDDERADRFLEVEYTRAADGLPPDVRPWLSAASIRSSWFGLARMHRKRREAEAATRPGS